MPDVPDGDNDLDNLHGTEAAAQGVQRSRMTLQQAAVSSQLGPGEKSGLLEGQLVAGNLQALPKEMDSFQMRFVCKTSEETAFKNQMRLRRRKAMGNRQSPVKRRSQVQT